MLEELDRADSKVDGVETWQVGQVCAWLDSKGWGKYTTFFKRHEIDGFELLALSATDLRVEMAVLSSAERKRMLGSIAALAGKARSTVSSRASEQEGSANLHAALRRGLAELRHLEGALAPAEVGEAGDGR